MEQLRTFVIVALKDNLYAASHEYTQQWFGLSSQHAVGTARSLFTGDS